MDKTQAETLRSRIIERRNYLKDIDISLVYSKRSLYGGMQERVRRKADVVFKKGVTKQKKLINKKLTEVNNYISKLSTYNIALSDYNDNYNPDAIGIQSVAPIVPTSPAITLPPVPNANKAAMVRRVGMGIGGRGLM